MALSDVISLVALLVAIASFFVAWRESSRARQLQVLADLVGRLSECERDLYDVAPPERQHHVLAIFFNLVEFACLLRNHGYICERPIRTFFDDAVPSWYRIYSRFAPDAQRSNPREHPEFKATVARLQASTLDTGFVRRALRPLDGVLARYLPELLSALRKIWS